MTTPYPNVPGVTFKDIDGFPGYCIGDDGSVWSRKYTPARCKGAFRPATDGEWRKRKPNLRNDNGLTQINLRDPEGKTKTLLIHRIVLTTFVGPCPDGMECCHNDGNARNNRLSNLRWDTHANNIRDSVRHGTRPAGPNHAFAKLTPSQVTRIRAGHAAGVPMKMLSQQYGIGYTTIRNVVQGRTYRNCP